MNNNIFNIDLNRLVSWLIPDRIKNAFNLSFFKALINPLIQLYQSFIRFKQEKQYQLMITPQVCYLERLLNDRYDYSLRRITIEDAIDQEAVPFYQEEELKYVDFYQESENQPVVFYTDGEAGEFKNDFVVLVPVSIVFELQEMTALVKNYKLAGTKFKIQRI